jgi:hypothetical protein
VYKRLVVALSREFNTGLLSLQSDVETPIYQNVHANLLATPVQYKIIGSFTF